jgi:hypothetical protein
VCSSSVACNQSCTIDAAQGIQPITCGQYGLCKPPTRTSSGGSQSTSSSPCPAGKRCIEFGHDGQGNVICLRCL